MHAKNTKGVVVKPLILESYLAFAKQTVGSKLFQKFFAKVNGKKTEVLQKGNLSCAFHISSILKVFSLISSVQITVHRAIDDMLLSGWKPTKKLRPGAVIVWTPKPADPKRLKKDGKVYANKVKHLGIFLGNKLVVHNSDLKKVPVLDKWNYRPVEMILWHKNLEK